MKLSGDEGLGDEASRKGSASVGQIASTPIPSSVRLFVREGTVPVAIILREPHERFRHLPFWLNASLCRTWPGFQSLSDAVRRSYGALL
jgi:hypothetical protein